MIKKEWSSQKESFIIKTKPTRTQLFDDYKTIIETNRSNQWFVYPKENDNWTNKLYRMRKRKGHEEEDPESFLLRNKIGQSKLGFLSFNQMEYYRYSISTSILQFTIFS